MACKFQIGSMAIALSRRRTCPYCGSRQIRRSHSAPWLQRVFMSLLLIRFFRCRGCWRRHLGLWFARSQGRAIPAAFDRRPLM
jgi:hypothetical protein